MALVEHSLECTMELLAQKIRERQYESAWPNYCRACGGSGCVDASDPSVGLYGSEPCEACVGHCPRCGFDILGPSVPYVTALGVEDYVALDEPVWEAWSAGWIACEQCGAAYPERFIEEAGGFDSIESNPLFDESTQVFPGKDLWGGPCPCEEAEMLEFERSMGW